MLIILFWSTFDWIEKWFWKVVVRKKTKTCLTGFEKWRDGSKQLFCSDQKMTVGRCQKIISEFFQQCDRMARLFFYNIWQFTKMKNCPIAKFVAKFDWQCCQILNKPSKNSPRLAKVAKFSQICGQSDKHLTIIIYNSRVVIWANM